MRAFTRTWALLLLLLVAPFSTQAATLRFGGPTEARVGDMVSVPVLLSTDAGESANAVSATISYSTNLLTLVSISKAQSIITLWAQEPTMSGGNAELEGVILNPGWSGKSGIVATLVFEIKAKGTGTITFSDANVYANDGNATPILSSSPSKSLAVKDATPSSQTTQTGAIQATSSATSSQPSGAIIEPGTPAPLETSSLAERIWSRIQNYAGRALPYAPYAIGVILLLLALMFAVRKILQLFGGMRSYKKLKKDSIHGNIHERFHELRDAVTKEMLAFQKAKTKRQLTEEEERFLERFKKLLDKTEKSIEKEISK